MNGLIGSAPPFNPSPTNNSYYNLPPPSSFNNNSTTNYLSSNIPYSRTPSPTTPSFIDHPFPTLRSVSSSQPYPKLQRRSFRDVSSSGDFVITPAASPNLNSNLSRGGIAPPASVGTIGDGRRPSPSPEKEEDHARPTRSTSSSIVWDDNISAANSSSNSTPTRPSSFIGTLFPGPNHQPQSLSERPPVPQLSKDFLAGYSGASDCSSELQSATVGSDSQSVLVHSPSALAEPLPPPPPSTLKMTSSSSTLPTADASLDTSQRITNLESSVANLTSLVNSELRQLKEQVSILRGLIVASPSRPTTATLDTSSKPSTLPHATDSPLLTLRSPSPSQSNAPFPHRKVQHQHSLSYLNLPNSTSSSTSTTVVPGGPPSPALSAPGGLYGDQTPEEADFTPSSSSDKDEQLRALTAQVNSLASSLAHLISTSGAGISAPVIQALHQPLQQQLRPASSPLLVQHPHLHQSQHQPPLRQLSLPPVLVSGGPSPLIGGGGTGSPGIGISLSENWNGSIKHPAPRSPSMRPLSATGSSLSRQTSVGSGFGGAGVGRQTPQLSAPGTGEEDRRRNSGLGFGPVGQNTRMDNLGGGGFDSNSITSPALGGGVWGDQNQPMGSPLVGMGGSSLSLASSNGTAQTGSLSGKWENLGIGNDLFRTIVKYGLGPPTKIQCKAIPCILRNQDIVSQAPSIQERIQSYVVPALQIVLSTLALAAFELGSSANKGVQVIIITATVDQSAQAQRLSVGLGGSLGIRTSLCVGQGDLQQDLHSFQKAPPHVLVGTPQRLLELFSMRVLNVSEIRLLVIDECDQLIARNLSDYVVSLVRLLPPSSANMAPPSSPSLVRSPMLAGGSGGSNGQLPGAFETTPRFVDSPRFPTSGGMGQQQQQQPLFVPIPGERQTVILSCTVPQDVLNFASSLQLREPVRVLVRREGGESSSPSARSVKAYYVYIAVGAPGAGAAAKSKTVGVGRRDASDAREWKLEALADLCEDYAFETCVIFCASVDTVEAVSYKLSTRSIETFALHQDMGQAARHALMSKFRSPPAHRLGPNKRVLVVYDALARTLTDVSQVSLVVNYDLPRSAEDYLPRIACATASGYARPGVAINFVTPGTDVERLRAIESHFRIKISELPASFTGIAS